MTNHVPIHEQQPERNRADGLHVRTPCPKRWEDLEGGDVRRFCSECALHVIDGSRLTRGEAHALVARATERVCMRLAFDDRGRAIHADSRPKAAATVRRTWVARAGRWAVLTTAALMAACRRDETALTPGTEAGATAGDPNGAVCTTIMGKVAASSVLGDVAVPAVSSTGSSANLPSTATAEPTTTPPDTNEAQGAPRDEDEDDEVTGGEAGFIRLGEVSIQAPPTQAPR